MISSDGTYRDANVYAPTSFWAICPKLRYGGCGAGKLGDLLIPDTIWGLNVSFLCKIHDHMYERGTTEEDRESADRTLRNNLMRWIDYRTDSYILKWLRTRRAIKYYKAVRVFGGPAFWDKQ